MTPELLESNENNSDDDSDDSDSDNDGLNLEEEEENDDDDSMWHLIPSPHMYCLVDYQYTLFEVLKGNQQGVAAGFVTEGHFFNMYGKLLCKTSYDVEADEYHIKPLTEMLWD
eukprot:gene30424-37637_t